MYSRYSEKLIFFFKYHRRNPEFDPEYLIAWCMVANHVFMTGKKAIRLHFKRFLTQLHDEGGAQVDQVGITYVGKKSIGKSFRILGIERIKIGFPEKINELGKGFFGLPAMVAEIEMIPMKEFYMLHLVLIDVNTKFHLA